MNKESGDSKQGMYNSHIYYIGIGEYKIAHTPDDILKTCGLGSCVAVIMYDTKIKVGGLIHVALPSSGVDSTRAFKLPGYYVDTGLPLIIELMKKRGVTRRNVWIKIAGGANTLNTSQDFDIGKRNVLAVKKYLWKFAMGPINEDVGGSQYRTVTFYNDTGKIIISSGNHYREL